MRRSADRRSAHGSAGEDRQFQPVSAENGRLLKARRGWLWHVPYDSRRGGKSFDSTPATHLCGDQNAAETFSLLYCPLLQQTSMRRHEPSRSMISCSLAGAQRLTPAGLVLVIAVGLAACQQQTSRPENPPTHGAGRDCHRFRVYAEGAPHWRDPGAGRERSVVSGGGSHHGAPGQCRRPREGRPGAGKARPGGATSDGELRRGCGPGGRGRAPRGDPHLRAPEGAARPGLHDQAAARSGPGSLPYVPSLARRRKGPARHCARPSFRHGPAGGRSRRHHGPQCRDGAGRAGGADRLLDRPGRAARCGVRCPRVRSSLTSSPIPPSS